MNSKIHRRVLLHQDARCTPFPPCPLQAGCARFTSPIPQGFGAVMANYRKFVVDGTDGSHFCAQHRRAWSLHLKLCPHLYIDLSVIPRIED